MGFQMAYEKLLDDSSKNCSPERRRKLKDGLGFAELAFLRDVWWPLIGNFDHLHPEYEVPDYSGASRFLDFAYVRGTVQLAIEIDGFATHAKNIDRRQFAYQLHRQNVLTVDGWDILRFAFDKIDTHPRRCQRTIQQYMGSRFATSLYRFDEKPPVAATDREIVRLARSLPGPLSPADIVRHLGVTRATAYRYLGRLVACGWLAPASGRKRIRTYKLAEVTRQLDI